MILVDVYTVTLRVAILYEYLKNRLKEPGTNISHTKMPSLDEHERFVESRPYKGWYFIEEQPGDLCGVCYITHQNEIGIYINKSRRGQGYARQALQALMEKHPAEQYLAHINPENQASIALFKGMGFGILQHTYSRRAL